MLLVTNGRGGSSITLIVAHTSACRSLRSETWAADPETARRLTRLLHRIWHAADKVGGWPDHRAHQNGDKQDENDLVEPIEKPEAKGDRNEDEGRPRDPPKCPVV
jgi:hypothetical protein